MPQPRSISTVALVFLAAVTASCQHPGDRNPGPATPVVRATPIPTTPMIVDCGIFECVEVEQR